nr:reverse transcriptase domain-containing protein [Tanacetum cinerariifolium]
MSWKPEDQSKKHTDKRPDFRGHSRDGRGANRFTPLTRTPKEILAAEANKFQPPPPMVTPIEELVRAGKLSHLIKEIKQGREQPKTGRKETAAKDKPTTIYMVRSWQRTVKQKITQSFEQGKEITFPPLANSNGTEGTLVIEAEIGGHTIHRLYIDGGSSMEILYEHCFNRLRPDIKKQMVPATTSLTGFSGETTWPLGQLKLLVTIGDDTHSTKAWMNFMIVKSLSPYNGIIGRPGLKAIQAVPSTVHGMLKFPTEEGIVTICSSLLIHAECALVNTSSVIPGEKKAYPANLTVPLHPNFLDQEVVVGGSLSDKGRTELCALLKRNLDIFAWQPSDMTGVPRAIVEHRLNLREGYPPIRQKKMGQAPERTKAIQAEVEKLVEAGIMREVYYHDWLSNPVMDKKHDGSWRMVSNKFTCWRHPSDPIPRITLKRMSAMANTTPLVTTVTKPATNPRDADATPKVNMQDFCEEYYEGILPIIMDKVRRDKRKEVHASARAWTTKPERLKVRDHLRYDDRHVLDRLGHRRQSAFEKRSMLGYFRESSRERRTREDSHHSSARARTTKPERLKVRYHLRYDDHHVLDRLGHRRQSAFDRLSETYSLSTTKSRPRGTDSRDHPHGRNRPHRLHTSNEDCPEDRECFRGVGESYDYYYSHSYRDENRSRHMKRIGDNESPLSSVSKSDSSDGRYRKSRSKRHKPTYEDDLTRTWMCEEEDPFTARICNFESSRKTRKPNNLKTYDGTRDPKDHVKIFQAAAQVERWAMPTWCHMFNSTLIGAARVWFDLLPPESVDSYKDLKAAFLAYFMQQKKYVKDPVEIHNIKQKDRETIEDFMKRFKLETGRMKGAPECMRISGFMHGVNNPKLTKRLNEHVSKIMEEMMITTTAFIQGEAAAAGKKKRDADHSTRAWMNFMIVRSLSPYNGITGRPEIREIQAVPSTTYRMLKFPVEEGIVTIRSTILIPVECISVITSLTVSKEEGTHPENFKVALHPDFPDHEVAIRGTLSAKERTELCSILKKNLDIFAWQPSDMTGVPRSVAEHLLNIQEGYSPVRQKKRGQAPERTKAIQAEVQKLVEAGIMREVYYHDWLSNPVMVKKHDGSWRMYVDFTDLNKACPQDCYPLPEIEWKVESLCGYPFKCFLDAYKGYHQIQLAEPDEKKTAFHTGQGVYCYTKMPFGLKNAGATYQWLVDKAFNSQIGQNIEVYFQAHPITVITDQPIKQIMSRPDMAGRLQKWSVMLGEHNITYRPRTLVKEQILAKKFTEMPDENLPAAPVAETQQESWTLFTGGSSCVDGSGAGLILTSPEGIEFTYALRFQFAASNNEAEYKALIAGLRIAAQMGVQNVHAEYVIREIHEGSCSMHAGPRRYGLLHEIDRSENSSDNHWQSELPLILWAHRTMIKSSHGDTPFSLTYETEAVIPTEIVTPTHRTAAVDVIYDDEELRLNLDLLEERHEHAAIRKAKAKLKMTKYYNARVCDVTFRPCDFVYCSNDASHAVAGGKLGPKWEGPYEVTKALGEGAYKMRSTDGTVLPRTWNIANLKRCYL